MAPKKTPPATMSYSIRMSRRLGGVPRPMSVIVQMPGVLEPTTTERAANTDNLEWLHEMVRTFVVRDATVEIRRIRA